MVEYLLHWDKMKELFKKADMLKIVHKWSRKDFSEILRKAYEHMDLVYGIELQEVKPNVTSTPLSTIKMTPVMRV